jgi:hypothetical protein
MSQIEGYVVTIGVYVTKSFYITDDDEESAVDIALDEFRADVEGLDYEIDDVEVLSTDPEYHEEDEE